METLLPCSASLLTHTCTHAPNSPPITPHLPSPFLPRITGPSKAQRWKIPWVLWPGSLLLSCSDDQRGKWEKTALPLFSLPGTSGLLVRMGRSLRPHAILSQSQEVCVCCVCVCVCGVCMCVWCVYVCGVCMCVYMCGGCVCVAS